MIEKNTRSLHKNGLIIRSAIAIGLLAVVTLSGCSSSKVMSTTTTTTEIAQNTGTVAVRGQAGSPNVGIAPGSPVTSVPTSSGQEAIILGADGTIVLVNLATNKVTTTIATNAVPSQNPDALSVVKSGTLGVVVSRGASSGSLIPIDLALNKVLPPIPLPFQPVAVTMGNTGSDAYVVGDAGEMAQVDMVAMKVIKVVNLIPNQNAYLDSIALTPNGLGAVVVDDGSSSAGNLALILSLPSLKKIASINITNDPGAYLNDVVISNNGVSAWVLNGGYGDGTITPIDIATATRGGVISVGGGPLALQISLDQKTCYVVNGDTGGGNLVIPVDISGGIFQTGRSGSAPIQVGGGVNDYLDAIALTSGGGVAFVVDRENGLLYPISLSASLSGKPIAIGHSPIAISIISQ